LASHFTQPFFGVGYLFDFFSFLNHAFVLCLQRFSLSDSGSPLHFLSTPTPICGTFRCLF
jgi:hypothetical protein